MSFDVVSLFTSVPKSMVINSVINRWQEITKHTQICLDLFCEIVEFCIDCSYFSFDGQFYIQKFGTAMGNPLSPIIADIVTEDLLDRALSSLDLPVPYVRKYVDDLFLSLPVDKIDHVKDVFNQQNSNIQFTVEKEQNRRLPFLDMTLVRMDDQTIKTEWYIKPIASGRFLNYHSHHSSHQKMNVAYNFAHRVNTLSTNLDMEEIKNIIRLHLSTNNYPKTLISRILNRTAQKRITHTTHTGESTQQDTAMDEHGSSEITKSFRSITNIVGLTQQIIKTLNKEYPNIQIATKTTKSVGSLLPSVKDKTPLLEQSNVIYSISCGDCDVCYIGMTTTKVKQRMSSHKSNIKQLETLKEQGYKNGDPQISWVTDKSALLHHAAAMEHSFRIDSVKVIDRSLKKENLPILESCHIKNTQNTINKRTDTDNLHAAYAGILHQIKQIRTRKKKDHNEQNDNNTNHVEDTHINTDIVTHNSYTS